MRVAVRPWLREGEALGEGDNEDEKVGVADCVSDDDAVAEMEVDCEAGDREGVAEVGVTLALAVVVSERVGVAVRVAGMLPVGVCVRLLEQVAVTLRLHVTVQDWEDVEDSERLKERDGVDTVCVGVADRVPPKLRVGECVTDRGAERVYEQVRVGDQETVRVEGVDVGEVLRDWLCVGEGDPLEQVAENVEAEGLGSERVAEAVTLSSDVSVGDGEAESVEVTDVDRLQLGVVETDWDDGEQVREGVGVIDRRSVALPVPVGVSVGDGDPLRVPEGLAVADALGERPTEHVWESEREREDGVGV